MIRILTLAGLLLAFGGAAQAQRLTKLDGTKMLALCTARNAQAQGCDAYLSGMADAATIFSRPVGATRPAGAVCVPATTTAPQMRAVLVRWLEGHRPELNRPVGEIVLHVLRQTYPCH